MYKVPTFVGQVGTFTSLDRDIDDIVTIVTCAKGSVIPKLITLTRTMNVTIGTIVSFSGIWSEAIAM